MVLILFLANKLLNTTSSARVAVVGFTGFFEIVNSLFGTLRKSILWASVVDRTKNAVVGSAQLGVTKIVASGTQQGRVGIVTAFTRSGRTVGKQRIRLALNAAVLAGSLIVVDAILQWLGYFIMKAIVVVRIDNVVILLAVRVAAVQFTRVVNEVRQGIHHCHDIVAVNVESILLSDTGAAFAVAMVVIVVVIILSGVGNGDQKGKGGCGERAEFHVDAGSRCRF